MSSISIQDDSPIIAKQDTSGISAYETLSDTASLVGGSIKKVSKKNFNLASKQDSDSVYLQFGRVDDNNFTLDVQHPFSMFQAFATCLSSFEYKV